MRRPSNSDRGNAGCYVFEDFEQDPDRVQGCEHCASVPDGAVPDLYAVPVMDPGQDGSCVDDVAEHPLKDGGSIDKNGYKVYYNQIAKYRRYNS